MYLKLFFSKDLVWSVQLSLGVDNGGRVLMQGRHQMSKTGGLRSRRLFETSSKHFIFKGTVKLWETGGNNFHSTGNLFTKLSSRNKPNKRWVYVQASHSFTNSLSIVSVLKFSFFCSTFNYLDNHTSTVCLYDSIIKLTRLQISRPSTSFNPSTCTDFLSVCLSVCLFVCLFVWFSVRALVRTHASITLHPDASWRRLENRTKQIIYGMIDLSKETFLQKDYSEWCEKHPF